VAGMTAKADQAVAAATETLRRLAICRSYADLPHAIRRYCERKGITRQRLDQRTGLADGHSAKLLAPSAVRVLGRISLGLVLDALELELVLQMRAKAAATGGEQTYADENASEGKPARQDWRRNRGTAWGKRMAARRALQMTPAQRSANARKAAQARWAARADRSMPQP
jgi:hypothetical protein